nr:uncharacterized protein LOC107421892 isoform X2 [Ziziphus jujuba var. spinosa]
MADQTPISSASYSSMADTQNYDFANLVFINVATQATIRLTPDNFFTWKAQWDALLYGYALTGYVDGSLPCPSPSSNLAYLFWTRQDHLLFGSLLASLSPDLASMVVSAKTSRELWSKLWLIYAKPSGSRIIRLREKLVQPQGSCSITTYMFEIKAAADELALLDEPLKDEEITIYVLKGLNPDLKGISAALRSGDTEISFEDLHERLLEYEANIQKSDIHTPPGITSIDHQLYKAAAIGQLSPFEQHKDRLHLLLTRGRNTVLHIHFKNRLSLAEKQKSWSKNLFKMFPVNCGNDGNDSETKSGNFVKKILGMCPRLLKQQNFMGETPLHVAAKYGNVFAVKLLIGQCVDHHVDSESGFCGVSKQMLLRMKNNAGDTALHESILMGLKLHKYTDQWSKHLKVAKILSTEAIEVMYDGNALGETPLYLAVKAGFHYVVRNGLVNMDAHATSTYYGGSDGKTILHEAVISKFSGIDVILEKSKELCRVADDEKAGIKDKNGQIPLQVIADPKICRWIIRKIISRSPDCCEVLTIDEKFYHDDHTAATEFDIVTKIINWFRRIINWFCQIIIKCIISSHFTEFEKETEHALKIWKKTFDDARKPDEDKLLDNQSTLVVATLIATVTFAAGFTLPGGYVSSGDSLPSNGGSQPGTAGSAVLSENAAFKAFLISDAAAMALSSCAVFIHLFLALKRDRKMDRSYFLFAFKLIILAMVVMVVAFMTGIYAVLGSSNAFAIASCVFISLSFLLCIVRLASGYFTYHFYSFIGNSAFCISLPFRMILTVLKILTMLLVVLILFLIFPIVLLIKKRRQLLNKDSQAENSTENTEQEGRDPPPRSDDSRNPETSQESNLNPKTPSINEESAKLSDMANNAEAEKGDDAV